jgi:hypothetical protein
MKKEANGIMSVQLQANIKVILFSVKLASCMRQLLHFHTAFWECESAVEERLFLIQLIN